MPANDVPEPTELVYPPPSGWAPALTAAALIGFVAGLFTWWPYSAIAGFVLVLAAISWLRTSWRGLVSLPRRQRLSTAPIPLSVTPPSTEPVE